MDDEALYHSYGTERSEMDDEALYHSYVITMLGNPAYAEWPANSIAARANELVSFHRRSHRLLSTSTIVDVDAIIRRNPKRKISAIKEVRDSFAIDLKGAKDIVEKRILVLRSAGEDV